MAATSPRYSASTIPLTLIVAATAKDLGIGLNGQLPWRLRREMQYFAHVTQHPYGPPVRARSPPSSTAAADEPARPFNAVIMGRTTWDSIPSRFRPLKGRLNIVLSRQSGRPDGVVPAREGEWYGPGQAVHATSLEAALDIASTAANRSGICLDDDKKTTGALGRVFVIGGSSIYGQTVGLDQTRTIMMTRILSDFDCDAFFPPIAIVDGRSGRADPAGWVRQPTATLEALIGRPAQAEEEDGVAYEYCLLERAGGSE